MFRVLLGVTFIVSSLLKLNSIDSFGLYIFGFNWFSMNASMILSRLLVGFEVFLGIALIINRWNRIVNLLTITTLSVFTVFLFYLVIIGDEANCHCFGDIVNFSPVESIVKNIVLFVLFYFARQSEPFHWSHASLVIPMLFLLSLAMPFFVNLPEFWMEEKTVSYDNESLTEFLNQENIPVDLKKGKRIVCFYSTVCSHCRIAAKKMDIMAEKISIPDSVFFWGVYDSKGKLDEFLSSKNIKEHDYVLLDSKIFSITHGRLPLILLMRDGHVEEMMSNQTLTEEKVFSFMSK
ncbi:MAG: DoxX family protein [Paludibacteraceae bacterium]|nr:DoxX family protein [Paludibacteraceae bacterium]